MKRTFLLSLLLALVMTKANAYDEVAGFDGLHGMNIRRISRVRMMSWLFSKSWRRSLKVREHQKPHS